MSDDKGVQSVERALDIIESAASRQEGKSLTEISADTGLHKSTVYRIINTLVRRGFLMREDDGNYKLGHKLIETASYYINELELQTEARPYIAEISAFLGMASYLGVLERENVVYLEKITGPFAPKAFSQISTRVPAYCSSLGKCLLSGLSKDKIERTMGECSFIKFTPNTISSMEELHKELIKVRRQGWAMDDEEYEPGHRCVGAPIYDYKGDIIAAISVGGDRHVLTDQRIEEVARYMMRNAMEISEKLGYQE